MLDQIKPLLVLILIFIILLQTFHDLLNIVVEFGLREAFQINAPIQFIQIMCTRLLLVKDQTFFFSTTQ